nr:MAG TPA: Chlororespiratory reduction 6 [Caudoviricetes sp.]
MKLILSKQTRRFVMDFVKAYPKWFFFIRWTLAGYLAFYLLKSIVLFINGF